MTDELVEPKTRRRTEMDIIVQILDFLRSNPSRKANLIMGCGLSHRVLSKYLSQLVDGGCVIEKKLQNKKGYFYVLSDSGNELRMQLDESLMVVDKILRG